MSENIKVFELAKEFNMKAFDLIDKVKSLDLKLKNHMSELSGEQVEKIRQFLNPSSSAGSAEAKKKSMIRLKKAEPEVKKSSIVVKAKTGVLIKKDPTVVAARSAEAEAEVPPPEEYTETASNVETQSAESGAEELTPVESTEAVPDAPVSMSPPAANAAPVVSAAPVEEKPAVPVRRGPKYSIIRVVNPETPKHAKPLIVEEAPAHGIKTKTATSAPKTFSDPDLARSASALIREEEEARRKKTATPKAREDEIVSFKSTDYLRRERVYQPKKKKLSLGRGGSKVASGSGASHMRQVSFDTRMSVENLAGQMAVKAYEVIKKLKELGVEQPEMTEASDWYLDAETVQLVVSEFGFEFENDTFDEASVLQSQVGAEDKDLTTRPPVVTIMGHVDHGKTSLLDIIRRARVAAGEAGGITQHIGAYTIDVTDAIKNLANVASGVKESKKDKKKEKAETKVKGKALAKAGQDHFKITFLDTPGHAAFTSMRSRGAKVTDIVVLVVSAVDGVMPQTREAIDHAKAAGVPLMVAVNKIDLPEANPDRIRQQLSDVGVLSEDWGGENIFVQLSAKTGEGVDKLLEMIQLQAELLQLKARATGPAEGNIIEAKLDKGRGSLATVLVRQGTLAVGDYVVAGTQTGKVRALIDDKGNPVREAGPSSPVEILGLSGVPEAGDILSVIADEKEAKSLAEFRMEQRRLTDNTIKPMSVEELYSKMAAGDLKEMSVLIKADVKGSAEAIHAALLKIPQDKVKLKILSVGVGGISESDVLLASASQAFIIGFNVRPDSKALSASERYGTQIKTYTIIYELLDEVTMVMEGMLAPKTKEVVTGRAEVRNVFNLSKSGTVAGCAVVKGKIQRSNQVRLIRDNRVIYTGKISGLKRFKDDAREVAEGYECGLSIEGYNDIKEGDVIEGFMIESSAAKLNDASA